MENENVEQQQTLVDFKEKEGITITPEPTGEVGSEPVKEESVEEEVENSEVSIDDLDAVPTASKFRIITAEDKLPKTLTISDVKLGKAYSTDKDGNAIEPEVSGNNRKYYKAKLIVEIEETIGGDRIRTFVPSIFYSVNEDDSVAKIPTIPKECPDEKLEDNFTSEISKLRNKYAKFAGKESKNISSSEFVKGLIGLKFTPKVETGEYKKKNWIKLAISEFVK